jgi:hypothetical protein
MFEYNISFHGNSTIYKLSLINNIVNIIIVLIINHYQYKYLLNQFF